MHLISSYQVRFWFEIIFTTIKRIVLFTSLKSAPFKSKSFAIFSWPWHTAWYNIFYDLVEIFFPLCFFEILPETSCLAVYLILFVSMLHPLLIFSLFFGLTAFILTPEINFSTISTSPFWQASTNFWSLFFLLLKMKAMVVWCSFEGFWLFMIDFFYCNSKNRTTRLFYLWIGIITPFKFMFQSFAESNFAK